MSALPPKADIAEIEEHVRFGPIADIGASALFDHLIGARNEGRWHCEAKPPEQIFLKRLSC
jgi:hypothetical protein